MNKQDIDDVVRLIGERERLSEFHAATGVVEAVGGEFLARLNAIGDKAAADAYRTLFRPYRPSLLRRFVLVLVLADRASSMGSVAAGIGFLKAWSEDLRLYGARHKREFNAFLCDLEPLCALNPWLRTTEWRVPLLLEEMTEYELRSAKRAEDFALDLARRKQATEREIAERRALRASIALYGAVRRADRAAVRALIASGADPDYTCERQYESARRLADRLARSAWLELPTARTRDQGFSNRAQGAT